MKLAHIVPEAYLDALVTSEHTYHLCVADWILSNPGYASFYRNRVRQGDYVILDLAAFEKPEGTTLEDILLAAKTLQPSEIVLPDDMSSGERTFELSLEGSKVLRSAGYNRFMAVPHGAHFREYIDVAHDLCKVPGVIALGIQEEVSELFNMPRSLVAWHLQAHFPDVQLHYLGMQENLLDLIHPDTIRYVRGADSSKIPIYGFAGLTTAIPMLETYPGRAAFGGRMGYVDISGISKKRVERACQNMLTFQELVEVTLPKEYHV